MKTKYTTLVDLDVNLRQLGKMEELKTYFWMVQQRFKIQFGAPYHPLYRKKFRNAPGYLCFDDKSDGTIYFSSSTELTKIKAIFRLCEWFEASSEGEKLLINSFIYAEK